jgi:uncharacterized protein
MENLYKFQFNNKKIAFNVETLTPFEVDKLAWDTITAMSNLSKEDAITELSDRYSPEDVSAVAEQLESLSLGNPSDSPKKPSKNTLTVWLQISHDCNLRCRYCFADSGAYHGKRKLMEWSNAKKACDYLLDRYENEVDALIIVFFGGEPLLNFPILKKTYEYFSGNKKNIDKPVTFTVSSNGTLLTDEMMTYLIENDIGIMFSIDGIKEVHDHYRPFPSGKGSYEMAVKNGKEFLLYRNPRLVQVEATYSRGHYKLTDRLTDLQKHGFSNIKLEAAQLKPDHDLSFRDEDLPLLEKEILNAVVKYRDDLLNGANYHVEPFTVIMKFIRNNTIRRNRCFSGKMDLAIDYNGNLYPCTRLAGLDEWKIGDVINGLDKQKISIWEETHYFDSRINCSACWARNICGGGCRVDSIEDSGDIRLPNKTHCKIYKKYIRASLWLLSEISEEMIDKIV